jgi:glutamine synthetase
MHYEPLIMVCTCDLAGTVRGKGFPADALPDRLVRGVGWTPTNSMITCFGRIVSTPFGPRGDLMLIPDPATEVRVDFGDGLPGEHFFLGDLVEADGRTPWPLCPRGFAKAALADLEREAGLRLWSAFEHEFVYFGQAPRLGDSYGLDGVRQAGAFPQVLLHALRAGGVQPETFLPEYGPAQFEVTVAPVEGVAAADRAVQVRELTRAAAARLGQRVSFAPVVDRAEVGNGVHLHFSLLDRGGRPTGHDAARPAGLSEVAGRFLAGVLRHMPALCAVTAPSALSYERLRPNRWSAAYNTLGLHDREAGVRICPVWDVDGLEPADRQFNVEYRAADAAASPYLVLGMIVRAGLQGIRDRLPVPEPTTEDPAAMPADALAARGLVRLPLTLPAALEALESDAIALGWMPAALGGAYLMHKRGELSLIAELSADEIAARYSRCY